MSKVFLELSRSELVKKDACEEGLALFGSFSKGEEKIIIPWNQVEYLWLEKETHFASWLFGCGLAPQPNFAKMDLRGVDLRGVDLSGANLSGAILSGADLFGADLSGANLYRADFSRANLSGANLSGAILSWAYLSGANLSGAYFRGTDLRGTDLSGADLRGADLRGAYVGESPAPEGWKKNSNNYLEKV